jgi:hypothetical protein
MAIVPVAETDRNPAFLDADAVGGCEMLKGAALPGARLFLVMLSSVTLLGLQIDRSFVGHHLFPPVNQGSHPAPMVSPRS